MPDNADPTDQDFALVCYNCALNADYTLVATPASADICAPSNAQFNVAIGSILGYTTPVTLSASGNPAGTTTNFSVNPVTPPGSQHADHRQHRRGRGRQLHDHDLGKPRTNVHPRPRS